MTPPKIQFWWKKLSFKILPLFMKIKVSAVFKLGTCGSVDRSFTHCATEIDTWYWRYKLFYIVLKSPWSFIHTWRNHAMSRILKEEHLQKCNFSITIKFLFLVDINLQVLGYGDINATINSKTYVSEIWMPYYHVLRKSQICKQTNWVFFKPRKFMPLKIWWFYK